METTPQVDNERYLIISDLHLTDVKDNADGWKAYKASRYMIDRDVSTLIRTFMEDGKGAALTLVLNGDIFDFDLVNAIPDKPAWPVYRSERHRGLEATAEKSAWKLKQILRDHEIFVSAIADFVDKGHRLIYVMGNHDREMHFIEVQDVLIQALKKYCPQDCKDRIRFEPWFFYEPGRLYVEHGQQYDFYSTFKYLLCPTVHCNDQEIIALPMGNLANRYLMSRMGFFNPHATDFILNAFRYFTHWLRHYAFSRRSLVTNWLVGSLVTMRKLWKYRYKMKRRPPECEDALKDQAKRSGLDIDILRKLMAIGKRPITDRFFRVMREFWIDRVMIALFFIGATIALALVPIPLWIKLMVPLSSFPLVYFIYEKAVQGVSVFTVEKEIPRYAQRIAKILPVRLVILGHTHKPRVLPLDNGLTFVDTGTWAPIYDMQGNSISGYNNYLIAGFSNKGMDLSFGSWDLKHIRVVRVSKVADIKVCQAIREQVFVNEQGVTREEEIDGQDAQVMHFLAMAGNVAVGTARMRKVDQDTCKIERVAVLSSLRGMGVGTALMHALESTARREGCKKALLHSQTRVLGFYRGLGYLEFGEVFMDARIEHIAMEKTLETRDHAGQ